jgi:hypothetical protein
MTFKIEKGVPLPSRRTKDALLYPFDQMVPGDSFAVTLPEGREIKWLRQRLSSSFASWAKRNARGAQAATRVEPDGRSVRIWMLTRQTPLNPIASVVTPPPVAAARVHKLADEDDEEIETPRRRGRPPKPDNGVRAVKGRRY